MGRYILFRLLKWVPSVFILLLLIYALVFFGAGDPIKLIFLQAPGDVAYDPDRVEAIRDAAGLNRPFLVQFMDYLGNIAHGNFGNSLVSGRSVNSMISAALPVTLKIGLTAIFLLSIIGIILGVIAALNQNKILDNLIVGFALIVWGIPVFRCRSADHRFSRAGHGYGRALRLERPAQFQGDCPACWFWG